MSPVPLRSLLPTPPLFWTRRFAVLSLLCVVLTASVSATLLSRSVAERMVMRNAELAQEFMDSLVRLHDSAFFLRDADPPSEIKRLFGELTRMPGLVHAHVFDTGRRLVWSTNAEAIGRDAGVNPELDEALAGRLSLETELLKTSSFIKPEHAFSPDAARDAIEIYIPVRDGRGTVLGVAELYLLPQRLIDSVHEMTRFIWLASGLGGLLTYLALVGLVMQADRQIAGQQRTIVNHESLAAVGDMASAVAHGLRNPLASIRSSAELMAMGPERQQATDIMSEVDRLQSWIRRLLAYAQQADRQPDALAVWPLMEAVVDSHRSRCRRQGVTLDLCPAPVLPMVLADSQSIEHALDNLVVNALDAMPSGGTLRVVAEQSESAVELRISDTGVGIAPADLDRVFQPFHSTKRTGLGVGLPLVRRTIERLGGQVRLSSVLGQGSVVSIRLKIAVAGTSGART